MAETPDKIIQNLLSTIDNAVIDFNESLPVVQKQVFAKVIDLTKDLELSNGRIKSSVANIRIFNRIKKELEKIILSKQYLKNIDKFILAWDAVDAANSEYFTAINEKYTPSKVFKEIKIQAIEQAVDELTNLPKSTAFQARKIFFESIKTGSHYGDMVESMRTYLTDTKNGDGNLVKYAKTITTDAINTYNATYNKIATSDLGLVWYKYVGSLLQTSRTFCVKLIEAKQTCMPYIHISQFNEILHGKICGEQIPVSAKTKLPYGMKEETTVDNLFDLRGGYSCGHQFYPVSSAIVPKELREKFE